MEKPIIIYKGERVPLEIKNSTLMRFKRAGGDLKALESDPVSQAITLLCAALKLSGDPIEHADDFPPIQQMAPAIKAAIAAYNGEIGEPGEPSGESEPLSPVSATD